MQNQSYYSQTDDISFIPLTVEQERSLFERYYAGDLAARDEIVASHLKLVAKLSLQLTRGLLPENDAISAGNYGLMQALDVKKFEVGRGVRFGSYLRLYVRGQVMLAIKEKIERCRESSERRQETHNSDSTLTGYISQEAPEAPQASRTSGSGNLVVFKESAIEVVDGDKEIMDIDRANLLQVAIESLTPIEAAAIRGTYFESRSFADIGRLNGGMSREGVRKAHDRAILKLRESLVFMRPEFRPEPDNVEFIDFAEASEAA